MQEPELALSVWLAGQVMVGFWSSVTVTVKVQMPRLPAVSSALHVTVVVPLLKVEPLAGVQVAVRPEEQLSATVAAV